MLFASVAAYALYLLHLECGNAAPLKNLTALSTEIAPPWVAEPNERGTWSILYSCTFTIFLCVYTAIHLNIPPDETEFRFWLRKTKWVFIAILGPEWVVLTALEQWILAKRFLKELNSFLEEHKGEKYQAWKNGYNEEGEFDMVYAHYVVMGGFTADVEHLHNSARRVTITSDGIIFLAEHGHLCRIEKRKILDKSKADLLAKGLVCVQVLWVAGQAIERTISGYPITLLEIHTLVHVMCVILMYCLWLRKPLNIRESTMVDFTGVQNMLAFSVEQSRQFPHSNLLPNFRNSAKHSTKAEPQIGWYQNTNVTPTVYAATDIRGLTALSPILYPKISEPHGSIGSTEILTLYSLVSIDINGTLQYFPIGRITENYAPMGLNPKIMVKMFSGQASSVGYGPDFIYGPRGRTREREGDGSYSMSFSEKDLSRLNQTAAFVSSGRRQRHKKKPRCELPESLISHYESTGNIGRVRQQLMSGRSPNYTNYLIIKSAASFRSVAMAVIPAAYGCIHFSASKLIFPTSIEIMLWKISCYYLIASSFAVGVLFLGICANRFLHVKFTVDNVRQHNSRSPLNRVGYRVPSILKLCYRYGLVPFFFAIGALSFIFYIAARVFLVVESFISLRHVPIGVYQSPDINFMNYIPHL